MLKILEKQIKRASGYVQVEMFSHERGGYCCGTCQYASSVVRKDGKCSLHLYRVKTYGCCNQWKLGSSTKLLGYDGRRLRVIG